jgi:hypothetical protein
MQGWGFKKAGDYYVHPCFHRDNPDLMANMKRNKTEPSITLATRIYPFKEWQQDMVQNGVGKRKRKRVTFADEVVGAGAGAAETRDAKRSRRMARKASGMHMAAARAPEVVAPIAVETQNPFSMLPGDVLAAQVHRGVGRSSEHDAGGSREPTVPVPNSASFPRVAPSAPQAPGSPEPTLRALQEENKSLRTCVVGLTRDVSRLSKTVMEVKTTNDRLRAAFEERAEHATPQHKGLDVLAKEMEGLRQSLADVKVEFGRLDCLKEADEKLLVRAKKNARTLVKFDGRLKVIEDAMS